MIKKERLNLIKKYLMHHVPHTLGNHLLLILHGKNPMRSNLLNKAGKYMLKFGLITIYYLFLGEKFG